MVAGEQPTAVAIDRSRSMSPAAAYSAQASGEIGYRPNRKNIPVGSNPSKRLLVNRAIVTPRTRE
jgi:hypothetical protein